MVAMYVTEAQDDWDQWLYCAAYAYNGAKHSGTGYSPNELMMGRKLRAPSELLRSKSVTQTGAFAEYHRKLVANMARATEAAHAALAKDQLRRERYYNRRVRQDAHFETGDLVWVLKPPKGKGITKLAHQWVGPAKIVQSAGIDNWEVVRDDTDEHSIVHCSFLASSHCPSDSLGVIAERVIAELELEDGDGGELTNDGSGDGPPATPRMEVRATPSADGAGAGKHAPRPERRGVEQVPTQAAGGNEQRREHAAMTGQRGTSGATGESREPAPASAKRIGQDSEEKRRGSPSSAAARSQSSEIVHGPEIRGPGGGDASKAPLPGIAVPAASKAGGAETSMAAQPKPPVRNRGRKRKAEADAEAKVLEEGRQRRRREAEAREARAARRQAAHHEPSAAEAKAAGADSASGIHGGADTQGGDDGGGGRAAAGDGQGAAVEMLRGRGQARWQPPMPELLQVETAGYIVERARRRVRNRAGRYVREHQVEYSTGPGRPTGRRWLTEAKFERLEDAAKVVDDFGAGDGV
ncbi:hypothetical protein PF001_g28918 [Phytophthora fragariae]|uniref:Integrase catalytic domain-containing protein n=1 Tax=Phytophthora fragariae TaxID=53985 RepID=A0A6A4BAZ1_9STRA|nr:hypothetical protein PF001_g28918 [Phytophthora fragariae]